MGLPELKKFTNEAECKKYYVEHYCNNTEIKTFDGICVRFYEEAFEHAFYIRTRKNGKHRKTNIQQKEENVLIGLSQY